MAYLLFEFIMTGVLFVCHVDYTKAEGVWQRRTNHFAKNKWGDKTMNIKDIAQSIFT